MINTDAFKDKSIHLTSVEEAKFKKRKEKQENPADLCIFPVIKNSSGNITPSAS